LFLTLPQRSYSIGEIATILRLTSSVAAHVLNRLTIFGILRSFTKHGKKYFMVEAREELPSWARTKILKYKKKTTDRLCDDIKKLSPRAAFLSGLFAGYVTLPVDILLVGRLDLKKIDRLLEKWKKIMGTEINYSLMSEHASKRYF
jgi:hypothetical protein